MPPRANRFITNWLAAYCGDEQTLFPLAVEALEEQSSNEDRKGWPLLDTTSENQRLVRMHFPGYFENLAPRIDTSNRLTTISSTTIRAIVEPISSIQFCMRGFLVDLSMERNFAMRVMEFQRDFASPQGSDDEERGGFLRGITDGDEATPAYAGIAYPKSRYFVGEINFSDFACFELTAFTTNLDEDDWQNGFLADLQNIVERISP